MHYVRSATTQPLPWARLGLAKILERSISANRHAVCKDSHSFFGEHHEVYDRHSWSYGNIGVCNGTNAHFFKERGMRCSFPLKSDSSES
jgi:hypothetical protein